MLNESHRLVFDRCRLWSLEGRLLTIYNRNISTELSINTDGSKQEDSGKGKSVKDVGR